MKKLLFSMMMAVVAVSCTAAEEKLHVTINAQGMGDSVIVISMADRQNQQTFTGKQGAFDFEIAVPQVTTVYLVEPGAMRGEQGGRMFQIPAIPGEEVTITSADASRYDIDGSKFYAQYHEADIVLENAQKEFTALQEKCTKMLEDGVTRDSVMSLYSREMPAIQKSFSQKALGFIKEHPNYEACAAIIPQLQDPELMKSAVALLSPEVREGRIKPLYQDVLDQLEAQKKAEEEAAKKQAAGLEAPDFTLNDINGNPLSLSSLRGKYVILDFWGSWCGWCIKGFPEMKEYYNKYKGKFEILGVDCNDTEQKWKDAVAKHELPWLHVYNPRDSKVLSDYGIQGFPTKIIIGPDGKIVKTIVGEDPAFYTLLDELFK